MLILTASLQWKGAGDSLPITSRNKPCGSLGFNQMEKRGCRLGEGDSRFFFASTDPRQCLWIWNLHSLHSSENLTLARNICWSQCELFCCLWCTSVHFPKLGKPATQGIIFKKICSFMTRQMKPYCDSISFRQSWVLLKQDGYKVCGLIAGVRQSWFGLGEDCLFITLIFIPLPSINIWEIFPESLI